MKMKLKHHFGLKVNKLDNNKVIIGRINSCICLKNIVEIKVERVGEMIYPKKGIISD